MTTTENNTTQARIVEGAIKKAGLESFQPFEPQPLNLPERRTTEEMAALIRECLNAGNDPAEDPEVQRAITQRGIAEYTLSIRTQHEHAESVRRLQNIKDQGESLIAEMKRKHDAATEELRQVYQKLGDVPIYDPATSYPTHDPKWAVLIKAHAALYEADRIADNWGHIMHMLQGPLGVKVTNHVYAAPTIEDYDRLGLKLGGRREGTAQETGTWDMLCMGVKVDLATTNAEVRKRVQTIADARARRQAAKARGERVNGNAF